MPTPSIIPCLGTGEVEVCEECGGGTADAWYVGEIEAAGAVGWHKG
jgi:hypothetical protein